MTEKRFTVHSEWRNLISDIKDTTGEIETLKEFVDLLNEYVDVKKENEQLKKDVDYWKQVASQYSNELNVFEHCKKYKIECKDIHWSSD